MSAEAQAELLAEGLSGRLRDLLIALKRWETFVQEATPGGGQVGIAVPAIEEAGQVATGMILRALQVGAEVVNHRILSSLHEDQPLGVPELMELTGLPRILLIERVNDLARVGLTAYAPDSGEVRLARGGAGLLGLLGEIGDRMTRIMAERWADAPRGVLRR